MTFRGLALLTVSAGVLAGCEIAVVDPDTVDRGRTGEAGAVVTPPVDPAPDPVPNPGPGAGSDTAVDPTPDPTPPVSPPVSPPASPPATPPASGEPDTPPADAPDSNAGGDTGPDASEPATPDTPAGDVPDADAPPADAPPAGDPEPDSDTGADQADEPAGDAPDADAPPAGEPPTADAGTDPDAPSGDTGEADTDTDQADQPAVPAPAEPPATNPPASDAPAAEPPADDPPDAPAGGFQYAPTGALEQGTGRGFNDPTLYAPDIVFPIKNASTFLNSQVHRPGGQVPGDQCSEINYSYPWRNNFCESRSSSRKTLNCPSERVHQGQDIRAGDVQACQRMRSLVRRDETRAQNRLIEVVAVEDGMISYIGGYTINLRAGDRIYRYMHLNMDALEVDYGQSVQAGDTLGYLSNDFGGTPTTLHLHLEFKHNIDGVGWTWVNPYMSLVRAYERQQGGPGTVVPVEGE